MVCVAKTWLLHSALRQGGNSLLTVAAVLKYADAVLKGYATAISVLLTGVLSMVLFGTELSVEYALGMTNVLAAVFLYNAQDLEKHAW